MIIRGIEQVAKGQDVFKSTKKTTLKSIFDMPVELRKDPEVEFDIQLGLYQKYLRATRRSPTTMASSRPTSSSRRRPTARC